MQDLLRLWKDQMADETPTLTSAVSHRSIPVIVHGLVAHTAESAWGVVLLYASGSTVPALPLIRSMLENVATVDYVLREPNGWQTLREANAWQRDQLLKDIDASEQESVEFERTRRHVDSMMQGGAPHSRHLKNRFLDQGPQKISFYPSYKQLSDSTHAGMGVVRFYTEVGDGPGSFGLRESGDDPWSAGWFVFAASLLHQALEAWDSLFGGDPIRGALKDVGTRIAGLPQQQPESEADPHG